MSIYLYIQFKSNVISDFTTAIFGDVCRTNQNITKKCATHRMIKENAHTHTHTQKRIKYCTYCSNPRFVYTYAALSIRHGSE